jgi:hypothetical protein
MEKSKHLFTDSDRYHLSCNMGSLFLIIKIFKIRTSYNIESILLYISLFILLWPFISIWIRLFIWIFVTIFGMNL